MFAPTASPSPISRLAKQLEGEHLDSSKRRQKDATPSGRQPCAPLLDLSINRGPLTCQLDNEPSPLVPSTAHIIKRRFFSPSPVPPQRPDMHDWRSSGFVDEDKENVGHQSSWPMQLLEAQSPCINPKRKLYAQQSGGSPKLIRRASKRRCSMMCRSMPEVLPAAMAPLPQPLSMSADDVLLHGHPPVEHASSCADLPSLRGRGWPMSPQTCSLLDVDDENEQEAHASCTTPGTTLAGVKAMEESPAPAAAGPASRGTASRRRSFSPLDCGPTSALPTVENVETGLPSVSPEVVAALLEGGSRQFGMDDFQLVDCRYWYEHQGGHIPGAHNMTEPEAGEAFTFGGGASLDGVRTAIILYCEFSSERAPRMFRHLRNMDRTMHLATYPALDFPHLYVLKGGYKAFWKRFPQLCLPTGSYTRMLDPAFSTQLKACHAAAKVSWASKKGVRKM